MYFVFVYLSINKIIMNALRQFVTATDNASVLISLPPEYRQQRLEIIVLPMDDATISVDEFYLDNMAKLQQKQENNQKLTQIMDKIGAEAAAKDLTEEILNDILNNPA